jgi:NADP-dependent 3-hydroxy acid dehydrogenase YdfG
MTIKDWINQLLDLTVVFSFDKSGFKRHCSEPLNKIDLSGHHGIVTGASSGIGLAVAKALLQQGMQCNLIARNIEQLKDCFKSDPSIPPAEYHCLDMTDLNKVYSFAFEEIKTPINLIIHNAGDMPLSLTQEE